MDLLQTIYRWIPWGKDPGLETLPFEELQNRYKQEPEAMFKEFVRRLHRLVFFAAEDYLKRQQKSLEQSDVEEAVIRVFEDFGAEFGNGEPIMLLVRFGEAIRRVLDDAAFQRISPFYFKLLPAYHLPDDTERRFLVAAYQTAIGDKQGRSIEELLSERFETTVTKATSILKRARNHLDEVIQRQFESDELQRATEGRLP